MKRLGSLAVVLVVALGLMAAPVSAAPGNGDGAVKADLLDYNGDYSPPPDPVVVGTVNVNTTASEWLRVVVNLSSAAEAADLTDLKIEVVVRANSCTGRFDTVFPAAISTNQKGEGNATVKVDISKIYVCEPPPESIPVMVWVNRPNKPDFFELASNLSVPVK